MILNKYEILWNYIAKNEIKMLKFDILDNKQLLM